MAECSITIVNATAFGIFCTTTNKKKSVKIRGEMENPRNERNDLCCVTMSDGNLEAPAGDSAAFPAKLRLRSSVITHCIASVHRMPLRPPDKDERETSKWQTAICC